MAKINFTNEHMERMKKLLIDMLINNDTVLSGFGTYLDVCALLHTVTINSLNKLRIQLGVQIEALNNVDEWSNVDNQAKIKELSDKKELINLIIGYKRFKEEIEATNLKKKELEDKLNSLKESQKTPEDKIKEIEAQIAELG